MKAWLLGALCFAVIARGAETSQFSSRAVHRIQLKLDRAAINSLRTAPRVYVRCSVIHEGRSWTNAAVHLKGATGSFRPIDDKPSFTLSFDPSSPAQLFRGTTKVHLNNSVEDASCANELLGSIVFRNAGIPAPAVTHAIVELNGKRLGLYVVKEGFTPQFIERHMAGAGGRLYEPGVGRDVGDALDEKWNSAGTNSPTLGTLASAIMERDLVRRWQKLGETLDVNEFATFIALEVLLGHRDGYAAARNNFRVFVPENGRVLFLPSGMDQLFGRAPSTLELQMNGSAARAFMETPAGRELYLRNAGAMLTNSFDSAALQRRVDELGVALKPSLTRAEHRNWQRAAGELKMEIASRHERMAAEIRRLGTSSRAR